MTKICIDALPVEVIVCIFNYVLNDVRSLRGVCKQWKEIIEMIIEQRYKQINHVNQLKYHNNHLKLMQMRVTFCTYICRYVHIYKVIKQKKVKEYTNIYSTELLEPCVSINRHLYHTDRYKLICEYTGSGIVGIGRTRIRVYDIYTGLLFYKQDTAVNKKCILYPSGIVFISDDKTDIISILHVSPQKTIEVSSVKLQEEAYTQRFSKNFDIIPYLCEKLQRLLLILD